MGLRQEARKEGRAGEEKVRGRVEGKESALKNVGRESGGGVQKGKERMNKHENMKQLMNAGDREVVGMAS